VAHADQLPAVKARVRTALAGLNQLISADAQRRADA